MTLGGPWGQRAAAMGKGGMGFGGGGSEPASIYSLPGSYSRDYGNPTYFGPSDGNTQKRQFAMVGKANLNLLDPLAAERAGQVVPIDAPDEGPLGGIGRYYSPSTPGGFFAGVLGAVGSTVGGLAGPDLSKAGSDLGSFLGKTLEIPMGAVGGLGLQSIPFVAPVIDQANSAIEQHSPYILRDTLKIPTNLGGAFQSMLNTLGLAGRAVERTYAGMTGQRGALPDDIQQKIDSGELSHDDALDELVMSGRGFTNDPIHNMVWSILTDPTNWASLGVGAVAGAVKGTAGITRVFASAAAREGSVVAELAARGGEIGALAARARAGEDLTTLNLSRSQLSGMRKAVNQDLYQRVQNGEDISSKLKLGMTERMGMSALGPVSGEATNNIVYRVADKIAKASDPVNFFSGSKAGQRSMEQLHMASSTGVVASLKPNVVRDITSIADDVVADGGDRIMDAVGTWGGNAMQEVAAGDMASAAMQTGAIPKHGTLNAAEATRSQLAGGAYDANIGKYVEVQVEKTKDIRVASLPAAEMRSQTVNKLAAILGVSPNNVAARVKNVSADMAMAVHGMYYYAKGKVLHTSVMEAIHQAAANGTLAKGIDPHDITMITPRTLTDKRLVELDAALKAGDAARVRAITENYDNFNWMNRQTVKDSEVVSVVKDYLEGARGNLPREVEIFDPATGLVHPGIPKELEDWARDGSQHEYGLANGMPADAPLEAQWRVTHNADGGIRNADPWLQFWADGIPAAKRVGRWQAMNISMFRGIRGERILWNQRRRFITDMASAEAGNTAIPPALADRIFKGLMFEAQQGRLLPRGMAPEQMSDVVHDILADVKGNTGTYGNISAKLTDRQVTLAFLRAMEGDVRLVGLTQKITGKAKSGLPGAGANYWGQVSEKLYPWMRFTLNPVFMTMELVEPYILNVMRGVPLPIRRDSEKYQQGLGTYNAIRQYVFSSRDPDGLLAENAEMNAMRIYQAATARQTFGPTTMWGRIRGTKPAIAERKQAAAGLEARRLIGDNMYRAFEQIKGPEFKRFWGDLEYEFGTVDRAEVAERWLAANLSMQDKDGHKIGLVMDLMNAKNIGSGRLRISKDITPKPGDYGFADVEELLDLSRAQAGLPTRAERGLSAGQALIDDIRTMTEDEWMNEVNRRGMTARVGRISSSAANDIWRLANGPKVDDFWRGHRDTFLRGVKDPAGVGRATRRLRDDTIAATRAFVQAAAKGKNLTEEEYIALHFDDIPRWSVDAGLLPPEALTDIREEVGRHIYENSKAKPYEVLGIRRAREVNDPAHPLTPTMTALREGSEDRGYVYIPMSRDTLSSLRESMSGYGSSRVASKYDSVGTDPLRVIRSSSHSHIVRVARGDVDAEARFRAKPTSPRSHDLNLTDDLDFGQVPYEVFTGRGWRPLGDALSTTAVPSPRGLRPGYADQPWLDHLFNSDFGAPESSSPWVLDFKGMLTREEQAATTAYEGKIYANINTFLRGVLLNPEAEQIPDSRVRELVAQLDASIRKGVVRERTSYYRGVNISRAKEEFGADIGHLFDQQVGDIMEDPAYLSTSTDFNTAQNFSQAGGHVYKAGPGHHGVTIEYDLPAGFHLNKIGGSEDEHLLPRGQQWEVVSRKDIKLPNEMTETRFVVRPVGEGTQSGTRRLVLGDPPVRERNVAMVQHLAATDPAALRALVAKSPEEFRAGISQFIEEEIDKASAAAPQTVGDSRVVSIGGRKFGRITAREGLDDIKAAIDEEDLPTFHDAWADTRGRVEELSHSSDGAVENGARFEPDIITEDMDMRLLAGLGAAMPEHGGRGAVNLLLNTFERLVKGGVPATEELMVRGDRASQTALLQAQTLLRDIEHPFSQPNLPPHMNDSIDVLLGNTNRRHIGRTDLSQPIVADDAAYEAAGYLTQETADDLARQTGDDMTGAPIAARSDETHAYLVAHYNDMAKAANAEGLGGFNDWTAADMALLGGKAREANGRVPTGMPAEAINESLQTVPSEVYFPAGAEFAKFNPLLDLLNEPANRAARHEFMRGVQVNLLQHIRDEFGIIVDGIDDRGIGIWDGANPQPLVPLTMLGTSARGDDLADILSYAMQQAEVWHYNVADLNEVTRVGNFKEYEPRLTIEFHGSHAQGDAETAATGIAKQLPFARGATALEMSDGTWQISLIDHEGLMPRLDSGAVDRDAIDDLLDKAYMELDEEGLPTTNYIDYGKTYVAGPDRFEDGTYDWKGHRDATLSKLEGRGTPTDGSQLDGVRTTFDDSFKWSLRDAAPNNYDRSARGDAITGTLEDRRGGQVFGTTTPSGASAAVVRGFGATDPLAGLHELIHVFSIAGMEPSMRDAITKEWEQHVTNVEAAATVLEQRAAAHTNRSAAAQLTNRATAMRAGINNPHPGAWGKAQEEFFVDLVYDWVDRGIATDPEMNNAFEHFRNWLQLTKKQRATNGLPPIRTSPQMQVKLDRMFSRPGVETVPYSIEQETMRTAARQVVRSSWEEAHATQYYKHDRSALERSINHPYIGLYPASYMWGKVLPEMVRFLALRPFGMTTPFLAWNVAREVGDTIRTQSENDPSWKKFLADNKDAFMLMSMMFPATPNDIPANASLPLRRIAEQGLENEQRIARGQRPKGIDYTKGAMDAVQYAVGPLGTIRTVSEVAGMAGGFAHSVLGAATGAPSEPSQELLPLR